MDVETFQLRTFTNNQGKKRNLFQDLTAEVKNALAAEVQLETKYPKWASASKSLRFFNYYFDIFWQIW